MLKEGDMWIFNDTSHHFGACVFICEKGKYTRVDTKESGARVIAPPNSPDIHREFSDVWKLTPKKEQI